MNLNVCFLLLFASAMDEIDFGEMQRQHDSKEPMIEMSNFEGRSLEPADVKIQPFETKWVNLEYDDLKVAQGKNGEFTEEKFKVDIFILNYLPIKEINCLFNAKMWRKTINDASKYQRIITQTKKDNQISVIDLKDRQEAIAKLQRKMVKGVVLLLSTIVLLMITRYLFPLRYDGDIPFPIDGKIQWKEPKISLRLLVVALAAISIVPQLFLLTAGKQTFMRKMVSSNEKFWKNTERRVNYSFKLMILASLITLCKFSGWMIQNAAESTPLHHYEHTAIYYRVIPGHINHQATANRKFIELLASQFGEYDIGESLRKHLYSPASFRSDANLRYFHPRGELEVEPFYRVLVFLASFLGSAIFLIVFNILALYYFIRFIPFFFLFFSILCKTFSSTKRKFE